MDISARMLIGEHPRIGALDVCPFVPLRGVSIDECVELAKEFGEKLAAEFHVPVYFYECAQKQEHRKTIRQIREMEYEGLQEKVRRSYSITEILRMRNVTLLLVQCNSQGVKVS